jgi:predicted amidohydrolase
MTQPVQAPSRNVNVSLIQFNARDNDKPGNMQTVERLLHTAGERRSDLVLLPEVFTGSALALGNASELAETIPGDSTDRLSRIASQYGMYIVGSLYERADGKTYNTAVVVGRDGQIISKYRKTHLFDPSARPDIPAYRESDKVTPGDKLCVLDLDFGRVGVAICSDIRFPEIFLNHAKEGAELVVLPTAFPSRLDHWEFLNRARATDNQFYMLSSGMVGKLEDSPITFTGRSMVVDPWGVIVAQASDRETVITTTIDLGMVGLVRSWWDLNSQRRPALYTSLNRV